MGETQDNKTTFIFTLLSEESGGRKCECISSTVQDQITPQDTPSRPSHFEYAQFDFGSFHRRAVESSDRMIVTAPNVIKC